MPLQLNIWLLLFGGLQGLLLSIVLWRGKVYRHGYAFLIAYLVVLIAQILFKVADKAWLMDSMQTTYLLSYKFPLLYGPLVWLFTRQLIRQSASFNWKDGFHFLPFLFSVVTLYLAGHGALPESLRWTLYAAPALVLQVFSLCIYHLAALKAWKVHTTGTHNSAVSFRFNWIKYFIRSSLFVCLVISLLTYLIYIWYPAHNWLRFGFLLLSVFIYWISYSVLQKPSLFTAFVNKEPVQEKPIYTLPALVVHGPVKKYANSTLTDEEAARILTALESIMLSRKPYRQPELSIEKLASLVHTNRYALSQVLNERLGQSYYEYINGLRVQAAKEMLADPAFGQYKIASVGYEAGFNSLSTFNEVFKKSTGLTPSQFKKDCSGSVGLVGTGL